MGKLASVKKLTFGHSSEVAVRFPGPDFEGSLPCVLPERVLAAGHPSGLMYEKV